MMRIDFDKLSTSLDALLTHIKQLERENIYLRQRESELLAENSRLREQNEAARQKIHLALCRLKAIEVAHEE